MPLATDATVLQYRGLRYSMPSDSFLTHSEALYALQRLWELCDGHANWEGPPIVHLVAASKRGVDLLFDPETAPCPILDVEALLPAGCRPEWTFSDLPGWLITADFPGEICGETFPVDLVTMTFLMLTRWEEFTGRTKLDQHGRAVRQDMLSYRYQCDDRPVLDQWALVLRRWLGDREPQSLQSPPPPQIRMTHDVDRPIKFTQWSRVFRGVLGELIARSHNPVTALGELITGIRAKRDYRCDPYYRELQRLMEWNEQQGKPGCFYWMTSEPGPFDDGYDARQSPYREIVAETTSRGHELGWHPGYNTSVVAEVFLSEKQRIKEVLDVQASPQSVVGGRQHYLRWKAGVSWEQWEDAGMAYDSSVGFADSTGFRCGTSRPFTTYSLTRKQPLRLVERPLALMDVALEIQCKEGTDPYDVSRRLLAIVNEVHGEAVLLIHNSFTNQTIWNAMMRAVEERKDVSCHIGRNSDKSHLPGSANQRA